MNEAETLVKKITEGIQEKKGKNIVIADLTAIDDTICSYFQVKLQLSLTQSRNMYIKK